MAVLGRHAGVRGASRIRPAPAVRLLGGHHRLPAAEPGCGRRQMRRMRWLWLLALLAAGHAMAHDSRPAYLEIRQTTADRYDLLWRVPVMAGMRLPVQLQL